MTGENRVQTEQNRTPPPWTVVLRKYEGLDPTQVLLDSQETSLLIEPSEKTLESWRNKGLELPFVKLGRRVRYRLSDVLDLRNRSFSSSREALNRDRSISRSVNMARK